MADALEEPVDGGLGPRAMGRALEGGRLANEQRLLDELPDRDLLGLDCHRGRFNSIRIGSAEVSRVASLRLRVPSRSGSPVTLVAATLTVQVQSYGALQRARQVVVARLAGENGQQVALVERVDLEGNTGACRGCGCCWTDLNFKLDISPLNPRPRSLAAEQE